MLRNISLLILAAAVALPGCRRSVDSQLVGTWQLKGAQGSVEYRLLADHSCTLSGYPEGGDTQVTDVGVWRREGDQLIFAWHTILGEPKHKETRDTLIHVAPDTLVLQSSDVVSTLIRVK